MHEDHYRAGYDIGYTGEPLTPRQDLTGDPLTYYKAGWSDGAWDWSQANAKYASYEPGEDVGSPPRYK